MVLRPFTLPPSPSHLTSPDLAPSLLPPPNQVLKLGTVEGRRDWGEELGPMSVNAFYNVHANTLFVPAALLQQVGLGFHIQGIWF